MPKPKSKLCVGENDLWTVREDLARQLADPASGYRLTQGSDRKVTWICTDGHRWDATVCHRVSGRGCPYCDGKSVLIGFNDLWTTEPDVASRLINSSDGYKVTRGSNKILQWRCSLGHIWGSSPKRVAGRGDSCPYCSGKSVLRGFNDLWTTAPNLASQLSDPDIGYEVTMSSSKKLWWSCDATGHVWEATVANRSGRKSGCPYCAGKAVLKGFNDLWTSNPDIAKELKDPSQGWILSKGSNKRVHWKCTKGHTWVASVLNRVNGSGCPSCSLRQTSGAESFVREGLRQWFPTISKDHTDRVVVRSGERLSVDMCWTIGKTMFICEYDGSYFHRNKADKDLEKTKKLLDSGYAVARIRENGRHYALEILDFSHDDLLQVKCVYHRDLDSLKPYTTQIRDWAYEVAARQDLAVEPCI